MKKINLFVLFILMIFGLASCTSPEYSFNEITGLEISDIKKVEYTPILQSSVTLYRGDYKKFFDVDYHKYSDEESLKIYNKVVHNYELIFIIDYAKDYNVNSKYIYFYNGQLYIVGVDNYLYSSTDSFTVKEILSSRFEDNNNNQTSSPNPDNSQYSTIPDEEVKTNYLEVHFDYGVHIKDHATLLIDTCEFFFDPIDYNLETIIAGDLIEVSYIGDWYVLTSYPGQIVTSSFNVVEIKQHKASITELVVTLDEYGNKTLGAINELDFTSNMIEAEYVVNKDGTFVPYKDLEVGTIVYGVNPASYNSFTIKYLYSYNPRSIA